MTGRQPLLSQDNLPASSRAGPGGVARPGAKPGVVSGGWGSGSRPAPSQTRPTLPSSHSSASKPAQSLAFAPRLGSGSKPGALSSAYKPSIGHKPGLSAIRPTPLQGKTVPAMNSKSAPGAEQNTKPAAVLSSKLVTTEPAQSSKPAPTGPNSAPSSGMGKPNHRWKLEDFDIGRPLGKVSFF